MKLLRVADFCDGGENSSRMAANCREKSSIGTGWMAAMSHS